MLHRRMHTDMDKEQCYVIKKKKEKKDLAKKKSYEIRGDSMMHKMQSVS